MATCEKQTGNYYKNRSRPPYRPAMCHPDTKKGNDGNIWKTMQKGKRYSWVEVPDCQEQTNKYYSKSSRTLPRYKASDCLGKRRDDRDGHPYEAVWSTSGRHIRWKLAKPVYELVVQDDTGAEHIIDISRSIPADMTLTHVAGIKLK